MSKEMLRHYSVVNHYSGFRGLVSHSASIDEINIVRAIARTKFGISYDEEKAATAAIRKAIDKNANEDERKIVIEYPFKKDKSYLSVVDCLFSTLYNYLIVLPDSTCIMHCVGEEYEIRQAVKNSGLEYQYDGNDYLFFFRGDTKRVLDFFASL